MDVYKNCLVLLFNLQIVCFVYVMSREAISSSNSVSISIFCNLFLSMSFLLSECYDIILRMFYFLIAQNNPSQQSSKYNFELPFQKALSFL